MATNYEIDYNDERFTNVENQKNDALSDLEETYSGMIQDSDDYYKAQIDASKEWADKQTELQNQKTDLAIKEINQQKDQTKKDYIKEQSGAYVDWRKQSNEYGAEAEQMASAGLANTGYSESSQVSMYNTYQNRVATAREAYGRAVLNYDNSIAEAKLQNSSVLAEIAYEALQQQLELSLQGFQYKNQLLLDKADKKTQLDSEYYQRYQDVLAQINQENAMAEQIRQYNESMAFNREQFEWQKEQAKKSSSGGVGDDDVIVGGVLEGGNAPAVSTEYYVGDLNPDAANGTFSNGYQPDNINGEKLKDSGYDMQITTTKKYGADAGKTVTLTQTVWQTSDGKLWYWEGRDNKYIQASSTKNFVNDERTGESVSSGLLAGLKGVGTSVGGGGRSFK